MLSPREQTEGHSQSCYIPRPRYPPRRCRASRVTAPRHRCARFQPLPSPSPAAWLRHCLRSRLHRRRRCPRSRLRLCHRQDRACLRRRHARARRREVGRRAARAEVSYGAARIAPDPRQVREEHDRWCKERARTAGSEV